MIRWPPGSNPPPCRIRNKAKRIERRIECREEEVDKREEDEEEGKVLAIVVI